MKLSGSDRPEYNGQPKTALRRRSGSAAKPRKQMRLYLDDDSIATLLVKLLRQAGHDLLLPAQAGLTGDSDAAQLERAIREQRVLVSKNHDDFEDLHRLVITSSGHHPGILIIRQDNDPARDMTPRAWSWHLRNLIALESRQSTIFTCLITGVASFISTPHPDSQTTAAVFPPSRNKTHAVTLARHGCQPRGSSPHPEPQSGPRA